MLGRGVVPMRSGRRAAQFPSSLPAAPTLSLRSSVSAASQGGACGVNKCPGGSIKGAVTAAAAAHRCEWITPF